MTSIIQTGVAVWCLVCSLSNHATADGKLPFDKNEALTALKSSKDALYLQRMAIRLIESNDAVVLSRVVDFLCDPEFLGRLEPKNDSESFERQRIQQVLAAVGKLGTTEAEAILLKMAQHATYQDDSLRMRSLISATAGIKKPSKRLIDFLNAQIDANEGKILTSVVFIFLHQAQPETFAEVEKRFLSPDLHLESKLAWISFMLLRRHNPAMLLFWEKLLKADKLELAVRDRLVQALFDYRESWYVGRVDVPDRRDAPSDVLRELHQLADLSLKLDVPAETKA
ncbi:MAG: hypothetical protein JNM56_33340, partial [Planctomycetia bacterium]|nr:hypothetical protein [Planctomycetia bacterium]